MTVTMMTKEAFYSQLNTWLHFGHNVRVINNVAYNYSINAAIGYELVS